jgi:hypothetical protein
MPWLALYSQGGYGVLEQAKGNEYLSHPINGPLSKTSVYHSKDLPETRVNWVTLMYLTISMNEKVARLESR